MKRFRFLLPCFIFLYACNGSQDEQASGAETSTIREAPAIGYTVLNAYPHDTAAFTQGLEIHDGKLYESTGLVGRSSLRRTDLQTGRVSLQKSIDSPYFAEGITILNDTIYQLTWQNREVFLYNLKDFSLIKKVNWSADGWGITHDSSSLYISDGSDKIYVVRPGDLKLQRVISVYDQTGPVNNLNELEFIRGQIFANRWQYDHIVRIDPLSGQVTGKIDLKELLIRNSKTDLSYLKAPGSMGEMNGAVLNGIAWDEAGDRMLVTGKLWPHIFEIRLQQ